ncbi:hypothetical protein EJ997_10160 [Flaviflexus ciconiae]|uniref:Uncharacterized protein n=1 Tax=Flaviflexus ciconiae TaxID=2496867 RepID=A0A3S9PZD1_9ACTO|nr:hypothetical protein [Flaviflexus ciconiae]AZQ77646.1 hypothetical protein EJ997_10160 [Flaviflexus ciconiae]
MNPFITLTFGKDGTALTVRGKSIFIAIPETAKLVDHLRMLEIRPRRAWLEPVHLKNGIISTPKGQIHVTTGGPTVKTPFSIDDAETLADLLLEFEQARKAQIQPCSICGEALPPGQSEPAHSPCAAKQAEAQAKVLTSKPTAPQRVCGECGEPLTKDATPRSLYHPVCAYKRKNRLQKERQRARRASGAQQAVTKVRPCRECGQPLPADVYSSTLYHAECAALRTVRARKRKRKPAIPCAKCGSMIAEPYGTQRYCEACAAKPRREVIECETCQTRIETPASRQRFCKPCAQRRRETYYVRVGRFRYLEQKKQMDEARKQLSEGTTS